MRDVTGLVWNWSRVVYNPYRPARMMANDGFNCRISALFCSIPDHRSLPLAHYESAALTAELQARSRYKILYRKQLVNLSHFDGNMLTTPPPIVTSPDPPVGVSEPGTAGWFWSVWALPA
jgi:hypothetical protein